MADMDIRLDKIHSSALAERGASEVVERKGLGHPDTICDALAEELSQGLSKFYLERFGLVLHHNVDKVLLWGGASKPAFAGGEILAPMEIYLAGRATLEHKGIEVPVHEIAQETCRGWLAEHLHELDYQKHCKIHVLIRPGSADLVDLYLRQQRTGVWLANDTSCGVGYAPLSKLEKAVLAAERRLVSRETTERFPALGEDVKLMGVRGGEQLDLTVACALIGRHLANINDYLEAKGDVEELVRVAVASDAVQNVDVNAADDPSNESVYLTVSGTSAEAGDDGQAGRGNRSNGLITPRRPMTMESLSGKNPVTHVGKLYNVAARRIAADLVANIGPLNAAECVLVSKIGMPVAEPQAIEIRAVTDDDRPLEPLFAEASEIVHQNLQRIGHMWKEFVRGEVDIY